MITQEPLLFEGTLRQNLDPEGMYKDSKLWSALEAAEVTDCVDQNTRLDMKISENGSNLSVGQKQLICLARAILRNSKILIIDEATANVDEKSDNLIQNSVRKQFQDCTVLTIAHRLKTIIDSDRIIVMDAGSIVVSIID